MHLVIPVYPRNDGIPWDQPAGRAVLDRSIKAALQAGEIRRVLVVSEDDSVLSLAERLGAVGLFREVDAVGEVSRLLPFGSRAALAAFSEAFSAAEAAVMVTDFRNPLLTPADIDRAAQEYAAAGVATLVSVTALRDNPCQLQAYFRLTDLGVVHCFEPEEAAEAYLEEARRIGLPPAVQGPLSVTRPFAFNWAERGVVPWETTRFFIRTHCSDRLVEYCGLAKAAASGISLSGRDIWVCEHAAAARILAPGFSGFCGPRWRGNLPEGYVPAGASLGKGTNSLTTCLFQGTPGRYCLVLDCAEPNSSLRILPINREGKSGQVIERVPGDAPAFFHCGEDVSTLAYWVLGDIGDDATYDVRFDAPGEGVLWSTDAATDRKRNLKTGEDITGRQYFPEVYAPEASIGILPAQDYAAFDCEVAQGRSYGCVLREDRSLKIASGFDLLRFQSKASDDGWG